MYIAPTAAAAKVATGKGMPKRFDKRGGGALKDAVGAGGGKGEGREEGDGGIGVHLVGGGRAGTQARGSGLHGGGGGGGGGGGEVDFAAGTFFLFVIVL
jgi:hypothetical protein